VRDWRRQVVAFATIALASAASAHSASDAYLTLDVDSPSVAHLQWDIALRDLDFVMRLDDDGDGRITWQELRHHQEAIGRYALAHIAFRRGDARCTTRLARQLVADHADGAYAALFVDIACPRSSEPLTLDYRLFFAIDPSHRAILVSREAGQAATALLSPENATVRLSASGGSPR
jgi:hypothetical protein